MHLLKLQVEVVFMLIYFMFKPYGCITKWLKRNNTQKQECKKICLLKWTLKSAKWININLTLTFAP